MLIHRDEYLVLTSVYYVSRDTRPIPNEHRPDRNRSVYPITGEVAQFPEPLPQVKVLERNDYLRAVNPETLIPLASCFPYVVLAVVLRGESYEFSELFSD